MNTDFTASAVSAGALISNTTFEIPQFQREYAWTLDEYRDFWQDLLRSLNEPSYFLGLVILTGVGSSRKQVVDGQQRLLTVTLLAAALHQEALANDRTALADRLASDFLKTIDYQSDVVSPRITLADDIDNRTLQRIIDDASGDPVAVAEDGERISDRMLGAFEFLQRELRQDLAGDPFRRLGLWSEYLTNRVQFAVFVHPDQASAYRVFEVINTRGKELTTGDLLKNYILSNTGSADRDRQYHRWQSIARPLAAAAQGSLVQYIRHVVTLSAGHIAPRDLFGYLAQRRTAQTSPPSPSRLLDLLESHLELYLQMVDPTLEGPASAESLRVFAALNELNVIQVRPLLMAIAASADAQAGMDAVLRLVVRRVVVGNLGTGNVERRLSEAARSVGDTQDWSVALRGLADLDPERDEFVYKMATRSLNKGALQFLRRSSIQTTTTPEPIGWLHFIRPRQAPNWPGLEDEDLTYWGSTIGNSLLISEQRRPGGATTWAGARQYLVPLAVEDEWDRAILSYADWDAAAVEELGQGLAGAAADVWY